MHAVDLLSDLQEHGLTITVDGDRLVVRPASGLTPELRAAIAEHKPALVALLTPTPEALWWDQSPWSGEISDAEHAAVVNADLERFGFYRPERPYARGGES